MRLSEQNGDLPLTILTILSQTLCEKTWASLYDVYVSRSQQMRASLRNCNSDIGKCKCTPREGRQRMCLEAPEELDELEMSCAIYEKLSQPHRHVRPCPSTEL